MTDDPPTDDAPTDGAHADACGCCQPPPDLAAERVHRLQARRDALDERLARPAPVGTGR